MGRSCTTEVADRVRRHRQRPAERLQSRDRRRRLRTAHVDLTRSSQNAHDLGGWSEHAAAMIRHIPEMFTLTRDLTHAARSLAKDRVFALVCVISLGIGIGAFVALATFTRMITAPARGINTHGLTELLVLPVGPLRAKTGQWATERWSYPDYQALRHSKPVWPSPGGPGSSAKSARGLRTKRRPAAWRRCTCRPTTSARLACRWRRDLDSIPPSTTCHRPSRAWSWATTSGGARTSSDPDVVGKSVTLDGVPHTVVGVAPDDFHGPLPLLSSAGLARCSSRWSGTRV